MTIGISDWFDLILQCVSLSLFAVGGAIVLLPEMHRFLVTDHSYISESQFTSGIALAQAAPGPNAMMMGMLGWGFGMNAAPLGQSGIAYAILGFILVMLCLLIPSCLLTYSVTRWLLKNRERAIVIAFKQGVAPVVVGTMLASSWIIVAHDMTISVYWPTWLLALVAVLFVLFTRLHLLILLAIGAAVGMSGMIAA